MQVLWIVVGIIVGLTCLVLSLLLFVRGDKTKAILEYENFKFNTTSLGVVTLLFSFVAFGAPFLYHQGVAEASQNSIPLAPSATADSPAPTATVTVTVTPSPESSAQTPAPSRSTLPSPTVSTPTSSPDPRASGRGPWLIEKRGIRLVVEKCSHELSQHGLFGCQLRIENTSQYTVYFKTNDAVIFVDDNDQSYGLNSRDSTLSESDSGYVAGQDTERGLVVMEANPPSRTKVVQLRLGLSDDAGLFIIAINIPYQVA